MTYNARAIERHMIVQAEGISRAATHNVTVAVSGRDIELSGFADTQDEANALMDAASAVEGHRVVRADLQLVPTAQPYRFSAKSEDGQLTLSGNIPSAKIAAALAQQTDVPQIAGLSVASGSPETWPDTISAAMDQVFALQEADLAIEDDRLTVTGRADTEEAAKEVRTALAQIPGISSVEANITAPLSIMSPYTFSADKTEEGIVNLTGFAPSDSARNALAALDPRLKSDLKLAKGAPQGWSVNLANAYAALSQLKTGSVKMSDTTLSITGEAPDAKTQEDLNATLSRLNGVTLRSALTYTPPKGDPDASVSFDRVAGLKVSGQVPKGMTREKISQALDLSKIEGTLKVISGGDITRIETAMSEVQDLLPEFETLDLSIKGEDINVKGNTLRSADVDQLSSRLTESGNFTSVSLTPTPNSYTDGEQRLNVLTGQMEQYQAGFWLPVLSLLSGSAADCTESTEAELAAQRVLFVSGSSTLDVRSQAAISSIAAIMTNCFEANPDLSVEIGGHTDNVGSPSGNQTLSLRRAQAVSQALAARGVPENRLSAVGYGDTEPVADNATAEGRSANRRTTLVWSE